MKVSRYRTEYIRAVTDLAGRMVEAAEHHPTLATPPPTRLPAGWLVG